MLLGLTGSMKERPVTQHHISVTSHNFKHIREVEINSETKKELIILDVFLFRKSSQLAFLLHGW
jgi:hypothetical protein